MNRPSLTRHLVHAPAGCASPMVLAAVLHEIRIAASQHAAEHEVWLFGGGDLLEAADRVGLTREPGVHTRLIAWPERGPLRRRVLAYRLRRESTTPAACLGWSRTADAIGQMLNLAPTSPRGRQTPVTDAGWLDNAARPSIRASWGLPNDQIPAWLLLSDEPRRADAWHAAQAAAIAIEAMTPVDAAAPCPARLIVPPQQHRRADAQRMLDSIGMGDVLIQDARATTPWSTLPGCDVAIVLGHDGRAAPRALAWAEAAGCRVIVAGDAPTSTARQLTEASVADKPVPSA